MSSVIFREGEKTDSPPKVHRIPALFYVEESRTLLAFAEQRAKEADDTAEKLVMKRGVLKEKPPNGKTIEWIDEKLLEEAHIDGHRSMNPCPVYDKKNKTLFLFFICVEDGYTEGYQIKYYSDKANLCFIVSKNLGQTWSEVTNLTKEVPKSWVTFAVGPGHGLQTWNGRLIVPAYAYKGIKPEKPVPHALSLYSDDYGQSWHFGKMLEAQSVECQMAEVFDDDHERFIYCNARSQGGHRVEGISFDNGDTFITSVNGKLVETNHGCQGSVVSFPDQNNTEQPNTWLLFSHPTCQSDRIDLGVYLNKSPCNLNAWSKPWVIHKGQIGYSDLAYLSDGWFACLMECRKNRRTDHIALRLFHFREIEHEVRDNHGCHLL